MCGIVGIYSENKAPEKVIAGLTALEYRGYDSAGIASIHEGKIKRVRALGKLNNLERRFHQKPTLGTVCIGHTRWATHGKPTEENAHPIMTDRVAVVHNGIIENYQEIKNELLAKGIKFQSQTDTEVIVLLIDEFLKSKMSPKDAVLKTIEKLTGSFALGIIFRQQDNLLMGVKKGSPLILGAGKEDIGICSDAVGLSGFCDKIAYLEDGEIAIIENGKFWFIDFKGNAIRKKEFSPLTIEPSSLEKGIYKHYMIKEIMEQPSAIHKTLLAFKSIPLDNIKRITIAACGTSYYAGQIAKYWFEKYRKIPTQVEIASNYSHHTPIFGENELFIVISQSGETADTIAALKKVPHHVTTLSIVNVPKSTIARMTDYVIHTGAGLEVAVASTKAFMSQLTVLAALNNTEKSNFLQKLYTLPELCFKAFDIQEQVIEVAKKIKDYSSMIFLGRGIMYPLALEGALKLKEVSYIHAEAFAAGELKHGPIALVDDDMPVVVLAPSGILFKKTRSTIQEVLARGTKVIVITDTHSTDQFPDDIIKIVLPVVPESLVPFIYTIALQMLAYYTSDLLELDPDRPRNLAKSVTVE